MLFISSSCLIALAKISSTMLNRNGETGHLYLVPDLTEKAFNISPLSTMLAVVLHKYAIFKKPYSSSYLADRAGESM